ncbi:hypothetical protein M758_12G091300 [Ceratodon purpureus]|nr:hypothetical protein M758_12G091300 [Ceratodon purpureus]
MFLYNLQGPGDLMTALLLGWSQVRFGHPSHAPFASHVPSSFLLTRFDVVVLLEWLQLFSGLNTWEVNFHGHSFLLYFAEISRRFGESNRACSV